MFRIRHIYRLKNLIPVEFKTHPIKCTITITPHNYCSYVNKLNAPPRETDTVRSDTSKISEQDYLVRIQNDPDIFGSSVTEEVADEGDIEEDEHISNPPTRSKQLSTKQYADLIKALIQKHKIKEAIDLVEIRMIKEDKVKPENYIYNLLLGACGRVGYTKKAFSLYNIMKKRSLVITPGTYTALFNACANSPWIKDGLTRTKHLHNIMIEKHYEPNETNYNAMIKAYGRCGDIASAFALVDEMIQKRFILKDDTLNFLLQACITDHKAGFRHALLVWRKFIEKGISPSIYTYNLLLRCIRDCNLGDLEATNDVINKILPPPEILSQLTDGTASSENALVEINLRPNLLARRPHLGNIISLSEIKKPEDRLLLLGGASSFLENMKENNCKPDVKTYTQLLDCIPNTLIAEKEVIKEMKKSFIKGDVAFFNMLIKRRSLRFDYESARDVVRMMKRANLKPDLVTYGIWAMGCKTKEEAIDFIQNMKSSNYRLNIEILGAMLRQACYQYNFPYVLETMELCLKEEISPNDQFMAHLDEFKTKCRYVSNDSNHPMHNNKTFQKGQQIFRMRLKLWKELVTVKADPHPWQQFREETDTDVRHYKDKSEKQRFKAKHKSYFRVKTSKKHAENNANNHRILKKKIIKLPAA